VGWSWLAWRRHWPVPPSLRVDPFLALPGSGGNGGSCLWGEGSGTLLGF